MDSCIADFIDNRDDACVSERKNLKTATLSLAILKYRHILRHGLSRYFELTDVNFKEEKLTRIYIKTELSAGFRI